MQYWEEAIGSQPDVLPLRGSVEVAEETGPGWRLGL